MSDDQFKADQVAQGEDDNIYYEPDEKECCGLLPYLNRQDRNNLREYKYSGGDTSIIYVYFWTPLANFLVKGCPKWLAPNMLTLIGFMFTVVPFIWLFIEYGTQFKNMNEIPLWFFWVLFVTFFLSQLLDQMDGKQARNTGCCSSLGLILDHGCDGFNMGCSVLTFVKLVQCGDSIWTLLTVTTSGWGFYVSTLEHFYIGSHFMGPGNMASDGAVLVFLLFGSMGIFGNDYWTSYLIKSHEFTFSDAFNLIFTITGIINVAGYCLSIIKHSYKKIEPGEITGHALHGGMFVIQVFGYTIPIVLTSALLFIGESPLINQKQVEGDVSPFYIVMLTQLFLLGHMNFALILRHVTKQQWNPLRNKVLIFTSILSTGVIIVSYAMGGDKLNIMTCIWVIFGLQLVGICHFVGFAIREMSQALGVPVFTTWDPEAKKETELLAREGEEQA